MWPHLYLVSKAVIHYAALKPLSFATIQSAGRMLIQSRNEHVRSVVQGLFSPLRCQISCPGRFLQLKGGYAARHLIKQQAFVDAVAPASKRLLDAQNCVCR